MRIELQPALWPYRSRVVVVWVSDVLLLALFYREADVASGALCIAHDMLYSTAQPPKSPRKASPLLSVSMLSSQFPCGGNL